MKFTIYLIINNVNNKKYVGQTIVSLDKRWSRHCWTCTLKAKRQAITEAISKYGKSKFNIFEIDYAESLEESNKKEVFWGIFYNTLSPNGYNLKLGGRKYSEMSQETKMKISKANKGKKASSKTRKRLSISHRGYKHKIETREKLSRINKGRAPHVNAINACREKNSKRYLLLSPQGEEIEVTNMRLFCKNNKLSNTRMSNLVTGLAKNYKGWSFLKRLEKTSISSRRHPLVVE